jgi:hypothetical protein
MSTAMFIMKPTSVDVAGGTASIRSFGAVDFSAATSLSLNGVFSSTYDNYFIVFKHTTTATSSLVLRGRLRVAGTDASGSDYISQSITISGTSVASSRETENASRISTSDPSLVNADAIHVYGPNLAAPTAFASTNVRSLSSAAIADRSSTHGLSTGYDGITFFPLDGNITGMVTVYGYAQ